MRVLLLYISLIISNYILFIDLSDTLKSFYRWRYFILTKNSECAYVIYLNS